MKFMGRKGFERLESRNMLATLVVNSLDDFGSDIDDGSLTLREAIAAVNLQYFPQVLGGDLTQIAGTPGVPGVTDRIVFANGVNDPVNLFSGGPATIELLHGELQIFNAIAILGPGYELLTIDGSQQLSNVDALIGDGDGIFSIGRVQGGPTLTEVALSGLTITGGDAIVGGGIHASAGPGAMATR